MAMTVTYFRFPKFFTLRMGVREQNRPHIEPVRTKPRFFLFFCMGKSVQGQKNIAIYISSSPRVQGGGRVKWGGSPLSFLPGKSLSFPLCVSVRTGGCIFSWEKRVSGERYLNPSSSVPALAIHSRERKGTEKNFRPEECGGNEDLSLAKMFFSRRIRPTLDRVARWTRD